MRLLGDVSDGGAFLADDGAYELRGHQDAQRDVGLGPGPGTKAWRPGPGGSAAVETPPADGHRALGGGRLVRDVGHLEGVALHHRGVQLLHGSGEEGQEGGGGGVSQTETGLRWKLKTFCSSVFIVEINKHKLME